jgi:hypothetical protein
MVSLLLKRLYWWPWSPFWVTAGGAAVEVPLFWALGYVQTAALSLMWFTVALILTAWIAVHRSQRRGRS